MKLENKVALVTGAASGIGLAITQLFVQEGAKVVATDIQKERLEKEIDSITENGGEVIALPHDVSSEENWHQVVNATVENFGQIDILVNNAGIVMQDPIESFSTEDFDKIYQINQRGVFLGMKAVIPFMKKAKKGSIINMSSISGLIGQAQNIAYNASKFAVRGMTKAAAVELGPSGIRVNSIHPGIIKTPMTMNEEMKDVIDELAESIAFGRLGEPEEIATLAVYLASDDSSYSSGSEFVADGGMTAG